MRFGLIGGGWIVERCHAPSMRRVEDLQVVAVADPAPARGRENVQARRQLDVLEADLADRVQHLLHGEVADHRGVDGELHGSGTLPAGGAFFKPPALLDRSRAHWYCRRALSSRA